MAATASLTYDPDTYDDVPTYEWNQKFNPGSFSRVIQVYNDELWQMVKEAICEKLGITPARTGGCKCTPRGCHLSAIVPAKMPVQAKLQLHAVIAYLMIICDNHLIALGPNCRVYAIQYLQVQISCTIVTNKR